VLPPLPVVLPITIPPRIYNQTVPSRQEAMPAPPPPQPPTTSAFNAPPPPTIRNDAQWSQLLSEATQRRRENLNHSPKINKMFRK